MNAAGHLRLTRIVALAALAAAGRLAFVALPNVSLSFLVLFIAGLAYGPRVGAAVGGLSRLTTDLILSGLHPVFLIMVPLEMFLGAAFGLLGRRIDLGQRSDQPTGWAVGTAAAAGLVTIITFSVLADTANWLLFMLVVPDVPGSVARATLATLLLAGLLFNAVPALVNTVVFATATYPILRALRLNGLLPEVGGDLTPTRP